MPVNHQDIIRITAKMTIPPDDFQNVYHAQYLGPSGQSDAVAWTDVATVLETMYTEVLGEQADELLYDTIELWNVTQDAPMVESAWPTLTAGTSVDRALPYQSAALLLFPTGTARSQGRKFLPGFTDGGTEGDSLWDAGAITALVAFAAEALGVFDLAAGSFTFGNWNPTLVRFAQWVSAIVQAVIKTQRRRSPGVGS